MACSAAVFFTHLFMSAAILVFSYLLETVY
jgi:hypothetical protein